MRIAIAATVALAAVLVALSAIVILDRRRQHVGERLRGYSTDVPRETGGLRAAREVRLADSQVLQDAAEATGRVAERMGLLTRVETSLERADLPLRASEVLFLYLVGVAIVFVAAVLLIGDGFLAMLMVVVAAAVPVIVLRFKAQKRISAFAQQLPDVLNLLAGALRAGFSFMQALESVAQEASEPARKELSRVVSETNLGRRPEDSLEDVALRMDSEDMRWTVMAVRIQREVGGNLAEVLDTVAMTMTERERLRREIKTLTAEGRFSAVILGLAPFAFFLLFFLVQRDFIETLIDSPMGRLALLAAAALSGVGFFWLSRIMKIEV